MEYSNRDLAANQLQRQASAGTSKNNRMLVTSNGAPVDSLTASMTATRDGPIVLQDFALLDHLSHFDRERIPERVVHAKGAGASGYFQVTTHNSDFSISNICKASLFREANQITPVTVRFSTVGGETGSADTVRDPRGFAVKFFTDEGVWDLVGNNTPIFFIRDPILFPRYAYMCIYEISFAFDSRMTVLPALISITGSLIAQSLLSSVSFTLKSETQSPTSKIRMPFGTLLGCVQKQHIRFPFSSRTGVHPMDTDT